MTRLALFSAVVLAASAQTAEAPSLKDTLDWLKEKIPLAIVNVVGTNCDPRTCVNGITIGMLWRATVFDMSSCRVSFGWSIETPDAPGRNSVRYALNLGLATVHPVERRPTTGRESLSALAQFVSGDRFAYYMFLTTAGREILITQEGQDAGPSQTGSTAYIVFSDEAMAQRVRTAFSHAVELCHSNKEPF